MEGVGLRRKGGRDGDEEEGWKGWGLGEKVEGVGLRRKDGRGGAEEEGWKG